MRSSRDNSASSLTDIEGLLAVYVAATIAGLPHEVSEIFDQLREIDAALPLLHAIPHGAGRWSVSDDERIDMIVSYVGAHVRAPRVPSDGERERLRAVGLTDFDIVDLDNIVTFYRPARAEQASDQG